MATKQEIQSLLDRMVAKFNEMGPYVFDNWGGSIQFFFPDLQTGWLLKIAMDGSVEFCDEKIDKKSATSIVEIESNVLISIMNKRLPLLEALAEKQFKVSKSQDVIAKILIPAISWL